jgi:cytochrome c oxidase subunit 3
LKLSEAATALKHHFRDLDQQRAASELGMWIFLMTELLLFGGLFTAYAIYRMSYPQAFAEASRELSAPIGTINTAVLIVSSFGVALAVYGAQVNGRKRLLGGLLLAIVLGTAFLVIKGFEYHEHWVHQQVPGLNFAWHQPHGEQAEIFFFLYFMMTGVHAIHLTVGIVIVSLILLQAYRRKYSPAYHTPVEVGGLYWHFVDVIWIFLYPLLYLIDIHH